MNELVIEKGIPLPKKGSASPMRRMEIGDSFVTNKGPGSFAITAKRLGIKIASRKQPDGHFRIWRVA